MSTEYIRSPELDDYVQELLKLSEFTALRELEIKFKVITAVHVDKDENPVASNNAMVIVRKQQAYLFPIVRAHYVLEIDQYQWDNADSDRLREGAMFLALNTIRAEKNEKGRVMLKKREPDIVLFLNHAFRYPEQTGLEVLNDMDRRAFNIQFIDEKGDALHAPQAASGAPAVSHAGETDGEDEEAPPSMEPAEEPEASGDGETFREPEDENEERPHIRVYTDESHATRERPAKKPRIGERIRSRTPRKMQEQMLTPH